MPANSQTGTQEEDMSFDITDFEVLDRQIREFEGERRSASPQHRVDYARLLLQGNYARYLVWRVQEAIEAGRPWPSSFEGGVALLAHLESFHNWLVLWNRSSGRSPRDQDWETIEREERKLLESTIPRHIENDFRNAVLSSSTMWLASGQRSDSPYKGLAERIVTDRLGQGSLITGLQVAFRMIEEDLDGGLAAIRNMVATTYLRRDLDSAKEFLRRLLLERAAAAILVPEITKAINATGLAKRAVLEADVMVFSRNVMDPFLDAVSDAVIPQNLM
jgi:hypothetical protein